MTSRKELGIQLEDKFQRLAKQRKAALEVPQDLGERIFEALEEVAAEEDLPVIHGEDATLSTVFINFLNEPPVAGPDQKNKS